MTIFRSVKSIRIAALLLSLIGAGQAAQAAERLSVDRHGIRVWTFQSPDNPVLQYRAETVLNTSLENAVGVVLDTERGKNWVPYMGEIRILSRDDRQGKMRLYMRLDFPFPLSDRDLVVEGQLSRNTDGRVTFKNALAMDHNVAERPGIVRIKRYQGDWTFTPVGRDQVRVTTSGYADPGGAIPLGFANTFVQQQPYQMLLKMRQQVTTAKYTSADLPAVLRER